MNKMYSYTPKYNKCERFQLADGNRFKFSQKTIRWCHLLDPMEWIISNYMSQ